MIEKGRYKGIPVDDRLCTECNMLEDERHLFFFFFTYTAYAPTGALQVGIGHAL